MGWLELAAPEGSAPGSDQTFGIWQITDGRVLNGREGKFILMRPSPHDRSISTLPQRWFSTGPAPDPSEPSRDVFYGTGIYEFEAQANITIF
jgi:hypothetical protein